MRRYVIGRLAALPLSLLAVSFLTFSFLYLAPGDAADVLGSESGNAADLELMRRQYGLDRPFLFQFFSWLTNALQGDLGISIRTNRPVLTEVLDRLGVTAQLALLAIAISLSIGILGGALAIRWRDTWVDRIVMLLSTIGMSVPDYFAATLFVLAISLYIPTIGVVSYSPLEAGLLANFQSLFFPALALALLSGSTFIRYVRGAAEDIFRNADFIRTARAKRASQRRILVRHVMPNTLIPLTTAAGLQLANMIGGTVVMESIFALPGLGQLMLASIAQRDYPMVQGCVLLQAFTYVMLNLCVDLLYPFLDPRVRTGTAR